MTPVRERNQGSQGSRTQSTQGGTYPPDASPIRAVFVVSRSTKTAEGKEGLKNISPSLYQRTEAAVARSGGLTNGIPTQSGSSHPNVSTQTLLFKVMRPFEDKEEISELFREQIVLAAIIKKGNESGRAIARRLKLSTPDLLTRIKGGPNRFYRSQRTVVDRPDFLKLKQFVFDTLSPQELNLSLKELKEINFSLEGLPPPQKEPNHLQFLGFREKIRKAVQKECDELGETYETLGKRIGISAGILRCVVNGSVECLKKEEAAKLKQFISEPLGSEGSQTPSLEKQEKSQDPENQRRIKPFCSPSNTELFPFLDQALVTDVNVVGVHQQPVGSSDNPLEGMPGSDALDLVLQDSPAEESSAGAAKVSSEPTNNDDDPFSNYDWYLNNALDEF